MEDHTYTSAAGPKHVWRSVYKRSYGALCAAWACNHYTGTHRELLWSALPKEKPRCDRWIINIRREDLLKKTRDQLRNYRLCSDHFESSQFENPEDVKCGLKKDAIPTIIDAPNPPKRLTSTRRRLFREETPPNEKKRKVLDDADEDGEKACDETIDEVEDKSAEELDHPHYLPAGGALTPAVEEETEKKLTDAAVTDHNQYSSTDVQRESIGELAGSVGPLQATVTATQALECDSEDKSAPVGEETSELVDLENSAEISVNEDECDWQDEYEWLEEDSPYHQAYIDSQEALAKISSTTTNLRKTLANYRTRLSREKKRKATLPKSFRKAALIKELKGYLPPRAHKFVTEQINFHGKSPKGLRYSDATKSLALQLKNASPKAYRILRKVFTLPAISTLNTIINKIDIKPGIHPAVIKAISEISPTMTDLQRVVILSFDEMSLKEHLKYNPHTDQVEGLEDYGDERTTFTANHASVFMIRSLAGNWKQPIAYFLNNGPMKGEIIKTKLLEAIDVLHEAGLKVIAIVCDQGSNNITLQNSLGVTTKNPFFKHNGDEIFALWDPPHLLKNIRNNMAKDAFKIQDHPIKWQHIDQLYRIDAANKIRMVPRLTSKHVELPAFSAMSVPLAVQVMSHSVAAALATLSDLGAFAESDLGIRDEDVKVTAGFVENFDTLFNIFNSSALSDANPTKAAFTDESLPLLEKAKDFLNSIECKLNIHCLNGWKQNINALIKMWGILKAPPYNAQFVFTRRTNQDGLEHFFGTIRGKGGNRDNPDPTEFRCDYRQATIDRLQVFGKNTNCEPEESHFLLKISSLYCENLTPSNMNQQEQQDAAVAENPSRQLPTQSVLEIADILALTRQDGMSLTESNISVYLAGYLAHRSITKFPCEACTSIWVATPEEELDLSEEYIFFNHKQYDTLEKSKGLTPPSKVLLKCTMELEQSFRCVFPCAVHGTEVFQNIIAGFEKRVVSTKALVCSPKCERARLYMLHLYARVRIHHALKEQNRLLRQPGRKRNRKCMKLFHE